MKLEALAARLTAHPEPVDDAALLALGVRTTAVSANTRYIHSFVGRYRRQRIYSHRTYRDGQPTGWHVEDATR